MDLMQRNTIQNIHTFISLRMQIHRKRKIENKKGGWAGGGVNFLLLQQILIDCLQPCEACECKHLRTFHIFRHTCIAALCIPSNAVLSDTLQLLTLYMVLSFTPPFNLNFHIHYAQAQIVQDCSMKCKLSRQTYHAFTTL